MFMWHVGDIAEKKKCKTGQHEKMAIFNESNPDSYRSIYGSLFSEFGEEITTKIHRAYAGRQISFPKKLYTEDQMKELVEKCAIVAWNHYMDTCKQNNISPANAQIWCVADDIRKNMEKVIS